MKWLRVTPRMIVAGLSLVFLLSACAKQIKPAPVVVQKDATLEELLEIYKQRLRMRMPMKALIQVEADLGARGRHTIQSAWRSSKGDIQLMGFNPFGGTLFELNVDADSFFLKIPSESREFEGELDFFDAAAGKQIPVGSLDFLRWVQRGGTPDTAFPRVAMLEKDARFFVLYLFTMTQGRAVLEEKVFIERTAFRVKRVERFDDNGFRRGTIELGNYQRVSGRDMPLSMKGTGGGKVIHLTFREVAFPEADSGATP
ncbi:MAG: hypothetical protein ACE5F7_09270 [Nitrospiria bacterium]